MVTEVQRTDSNTIHVTKTRTRRSNIQR